MWYILAGRRDKGGDDDVFLLLVEKYYISS